MKRILLIVPLVMFDASPAHAVPAGIPVFDATNIVVWTAELQKWKDQIEQATETVRVGTATYDALKGVTDLEDVITSPLLWQFLPANFMEVYEQGVELGLDSLFTEALDLYNTTLSNDVCRRMTGKTQKNCYARQTGGYNLMVMSRKVMNNANRRQEQIDRAKDRLKTTELPKDRDALNTALNAEAAAAQVELITLQSMRMAREASEEIAEQQRSQLAYEVYNITEPVVFDDYVPGSLD